MEGEFFPDLDMLTSLLSEKKKNTKNSLIEEIEEKTGLLFIPMKYNERKWWCFLREEWISMSMYLFEPQDGKYFKAFLPNKIKLSSNYLVCWVT